MFDAKVTHLMRDEYRIRQVTRVAADSLEELATTLEQEHEVDAEEFLKTVAAFNASVSQDVPFDPTVKDGRCTTGLAIDKNNWATTLDTPPFEAFGVTCGITFTFGGLRITPKAQVVDEDLVPIPGLYAAGTGRRDFLPQLSRGDRIAQRRGFGRIAGTQAAGTE
ncbi:MAG: hypothetical protein Ct9H300mP16_00480 [Pseudomonadota bacterium]|nr:MAG: hypothetical protein Ct9H300mP16_00480 [Pseudomonadota bacterium]